MKSKQDADIRYIVTRGMRTPADGYIRCLTYCERGPSNQRWLGQLCCTVNDQPKVSSQQVSECACTPERLPLNTYSLITSALETRNLAPLSQRTQKHRFTLAVTWLTSIINGATQHISASYRRVCCRLQMTWTVSDHPPNPPTQGGHCRRSVILVYCHLPAPQHTGVRCKSATGTHIR